MSTNQPMEPTPNAVTARIIQVAVISMQPHTHTYLRKVRIASNSINSVATHFIQSAPRAWATLYSCTYVWLQAAWNCRQKECTYYVTITLYYKQQETQQNVKHYALACLRSRMCTSMSAAVCLLWSTYVRSELIECTAISATTSRLETVDINVVHR